MTIHPKLADQATGFDVYLPSWIAGSYMIRDFARHIVSISAHDDHGKPVIIKPLSQSSWWVETHKQVKLSYTVYAHDTSVRTAFLDSYTGFFNATSLLLSAPHLAHLKHTLEIKSPKGFEHWQVATTLPRTIRTAVKKFGQYWASNYDELADHPVRMGDLSWLSFTVCGVPHQIVFSGRVDDLDKKTLIDDLTRVCEAQITFFEPKTHAAPFTEYLFLVDVRGDGYGGLEHRSSTALLCTRDDLPKKTDSSAPRNKKYLNFLGLCSHEYFHSWNVKRIKPDNFVNYDLTQTTDTSLLWFFEGMTSYYDDLFLLRTGILSEEQYFERLCESLNAVMNHQGHLQQSVVDSGYYAWTKYYQTSPNTPNAVVSYYTKGSLIGLALDLYLRLHSNHRYSLDDVMRALWGLCGRQFDRLYRIGQAQGVTYEQIAQICDNLVEGSQAYLNQITHTTQDMGLGHLLEAHGIDLALQVPQAVDLGAACKKVESGYQIIRTFTDGAAQKALLAPDDVLIAFNQMRLTCPPDEALSAYGVDQVIKVDFWRDDILCQANLILEPTRKGQYHMKRSP